MEKLAESYEKVNTKAKIDIQESDSTTGMTSLQYSYSVDMGCWSCYMSYEDLMNNLVDLTGDYYVKVKNAGSDYVLVH